MNLRIIPKIELHVHLDGSIPLETASYLSYEKIDNLYYEMIAPEGCEDLNEYLTKFDFPNKLMQTKENLTKIASALDDELEDENVLYAEVRFAPLKETKKGLSLDEIVEATLAGFNKGLVKTNLILCMMRDDKDEDNKKVIDLAAKYLNNGVVAVDLAGAEGLYKTSKFEKLFAYAKKKNVPFTIHAGEADDVSSIESALSFGAKRIGHGVNAIHDEKMMNILKDNEILLEICPTSNVQTKVVSSIKNHPIKNFINYGIKTCINTDNRTVSNTTLTKEYELLVKDLKLTEEDIINCNINAIKGSFLNEDEKEILLDQYNDEIKRYKKLK